MGGLGTRLGIEEQSFTGGVWRPTGMCVCYLLEISFSSEYSSEGWAAVTIIALSIDCKKVLVMDS